MGRRERASEGGCRKAPTFLPAVVSSPSAWEPLTDGGGGVEGGTLSRCRKEMWIEREGVGFGA